MNKNRQAPSHWSTIGLAALLAVMFGSRPVATALAAQLAQPAGTRASAPSAASVQIPSEALQRQIQQLQRAQHLLEMAAGNDHASPSAFAARHIQMAINEIKLELQHRAATAKGDARRAPKNAASVSQN
ncbi:MAG: hypothetical protein ACLQBA_11465 [Candidatus Binataceae bacterium]